MTGTVAPRVLVVEPAASGGLHAHVREELAALLAAGWDARRADVDVRPRPDPRADLATVRTLCREMRRGGYDAIHAHGLRAGALAGLARAGRRSADRRPRLVVTLHNRTLGAVLARAIGAVLLVTVARTSDVVLAVSEDLAASARAAGARDVRLAVVPAPRAAPITGPSAGRPTTGPSRQGPLDVLVIARLAPQKGLPTLLDAVAHLERRAPGTVRVRIVGEGPERGALSARVNAQSLPVELLGARDDVPALLETCDVVVSSSVWEGQPVALQEALRAGRAIVATDAGGTREVTGFAATLVPVGDGAALGEAILALRDGGARARAEEASRRRAAELPVLDDMLDQLRDVLVPGLGHR